MADVATKSGFKTTEFWVTVSTLVAVITGTAMGKPIDPVVAASGAVVTSVYSLVRLFAKKAAQ